MSGIEIMYLVFVLIGVVFLGISLISGGADLDLNLEVGDPDFDISDAEVVTDSPSVFSMRTISTFLLAFGIAGIVTVYNGGGLGAQISAGFIAGFTTAAFYFFVMKGMYSMQGSSNVDSSNMVGSIGTVTTPTTDTGICQVRVNSHVGAHEYTCREVNNKKLKQNQSVKVIQAFGGTLTVESIEN